MADPIRVTVLGHSFVRRAHKFTQDKQIDNLYLPPEHFTLQMLGQGGAHWSDLMDMFERCSSEREAPFVWRNYDREFRKHYAKNNNLPWEKLDYEILHRLQPARSVQSTQPSYQQQPFQRATGGQPPDKAPGTPQR